MARRSSRERIWEGHVFRARGNARKRMAPLGPRITSITANACITVEERPFRDCVTTQTALKKWNDITNKSREAAEDFSPRRKPWVRSGKSPSPIGAKDQLRHSLFRAA